MPRASRVQRSPDAGVGPAVGLINKHKNFHRMLMFSMKSLSDYCSPSILLFEENSLDVLNRNGVPDILESLNNFPGDEDLMACATRILWAMSVALKNEDDSALVKKFVDQGGLNGIVTVVNSGPSDVEVIENAMSFVENMNDVRQTIDGAALAPGLLATLSKGKMPAKTTKKVMAALAITSQSQAGATALKKAGGAPVICSYCLQHGDMDQDAVQMIEGAFDTCKYMAEKGCTDSATLDICIKLMEKYKTKKSASVKGSAALAAMVGPEELQKCLKILKTHEVGSQEHDEAMIMLGSMSYISAYTDAIVKAGGIPMLIELINSGTSQCADAPDNDKAYVIISGASNMLGRIASNAANVEAVYNAGGVASLCTALSYCTEKAANHAECVGALCSALVPLANRESYANEIVKYQAIANALPLLYEHVSKTELSTPAMELVAAVSQHKDLHDHMRECQAVEICSTCCEYNTEDTPFQLNAIGAMSRLSGNIASLEQVYNFRGFVGVVKSLKANMKNEGVVFAALLLLEKFSSVRDATTYMCDGELVDAILEAMLTHEGNEKLVNAGVNILGVIATEADCKRHLDDLDRAIQGAKNDSERVYKTLAATCGLYKVPHLRQIIERKDAEKIVLTGIQNWIEAPKFDGQSKVIQAGIKTVKTLTMNKSGQLVDTLVMLTEAANLPQMKRLIELQEPDNNVLIDCMMVVRELAAAERITTEPDIEQAVEAVLKVMRKYSDSRKAQNICLETLNYIALANNGAGVAVLVKGGAIKAVVGFLYKAPMYLDSQIAGFTVLSTCVKFEPSTADILQKSNCLEALNAAMRTHSKSKELRRTIAPLLAVLMPADALEREIREHLRFIQEAMQTESFAHLNESLGGLNALLVTAEGSKLGARCDVGKVVNDVEKHLTARAAMIQGTKLEEMSGKDLYDSLLSETANVITQTSQTRSGCVHCTKSDNVNSLISIYENIKPPRTAVNEEAVSRALEGLRILLKHDTNNADVAFQRNFVGSLCKGIDSYPESDTVLTNICGCLAAMATTSSRVEQLVKEPSFDELLNKLLKIIDTSPSRASKMRAILALQDLLQTEEPQMTEKVGSAQAVAILMKQLHETADDPDLTREAAKTLGMIGNINGLRRFYPDDARSPMEIISHAMSVNKNKLETCIPLLDVMNKLTNSSDKAMLSDMGCLETVADVMAVHNENEDIVRMGGEFFAKMGADEQIKALMQQIIKTVEAGEDDMNQKVDNLCGRLALFLASPLENPANALQHTVPCLQALSQCLTNPDEARLHGNVAAVARRLCDRSFDDPEDAYGAWAVTSSGLMNQLANVINAEVADKNKKFLVPTYRTFAACAKNPYCQEPFQAMAVEVLPHTFTLLDLHQADGEIAARILEFLRYLAEEPSGTGAQAIIQQPKIIQKIGLLMNQHNKLDPVCVAGMGLLGALAAKGLLNDPTTTSAVLQDCEGLVTVSPSVQRQMSYMSMLENIMSNSALIGAIQEGNYIEKAVARVKLEEQEKCLSESDRALLIAGLGQLLGTAASVGLVNQVDRSKGFDALLRGLDDHPDDPRVVKNVCLAMMQMSSDPNMASRTVRDAMPKLCTECSPTIQSNPECSLAFANLCGVLAGIPGCGGQMLGITGLEETLQGVENLGDYYGDEFGKALKESAAMSRQAIINDKPKEKMCKDVYDLLTGRAAEVPPLSLSVTEEPFLMDEILFVFSQMEMYGKEALNYQTALGVDHQYGNMALELCAADPTNVSTMVSNNFIKMELACIKNQADEEIVLYAVKALIGFAKNVPAQQECVKVAGFATVAADCVGRIRKDQVFSNERREEHIIVRSQMIERTAINRNVYNKTHIMEYLLACWDDFDRKLYSTSLLRYVFRAMRRVVSDAHVELLLQANVLKRLTDLLNNPQSDMALLPDVLFLLGSLAVVPEIKTKIGEIGGVNACAGVLKRFVEEPSATPVLTNCCLALANICIGHKKNAAIFCQLNGPELNVEVLSKRAAEYDATNGGSVLMCNVVYKNENMKKYYGTIAAPVALVKALQHYDGSEGKNVIRCLQSLFKAISNMSLFTPNIQLFLDGRIEEAYQTWLDSLSPTFPDSVLETGLRTLFNLVTENEETNMRRFGINLLPCLKVVRQGRSDAKVMLLLFNIMHCLCRLEANAMLFADNDGIPTTMEYIHLFDYDVGVLTAGIHLLGIQSTIEANIPKLTSAGVFSVLLGCIEVDGEGNEVTELVVGSIRCSRRLVQSEELAYEFCQAGGISSISAVIRRSVNLPMVMMEACRVLICLLHHAAQSGGDNAVVEAAEDANATGGAEGTVSAPVEGPGVNDVCLRLGLDLGTIVEMVPVMCGCLLEEGHTKQLRLQRMVLGVCAYFASRHIAVDSLVASEIGKSLGSALDNFPGEMGLVQTVCATITGIATSSGNLYEAIRTKDLTSSLKSSVGKMASKKPEEKELQSKAQAVLAAFSSSHDPFDAFANIPLGYDLAVTQWNVEPYRHGVQDLPSNVKDALRKGGKFKLVYGEKEREAFQWRARQDLNALEWTVGENATEFTNRASIVQIRNVKKGLENEDLKKANKKDPRRVTAKVCLCIVGPPTEDNIDGIELAIKTKSQKERDAFVDMMVQWREAATYNF